MKPILKLTVSVDDYNALLRLAHAADTGLYSRLAVAIEHPGLQATPTQRRA